MRPGRSLLLCAWMLAPGAALAHVGTLNAIYETQAPPAPVRVIIRPPGVVPGLAEIDVRVLTNGVQRVTVLPVHWRAGLAGAPPPDVAVPVKGEPNLYHAELWLMARGAYSVHVTVETSHGTNTVIVPVNSLATSRLPMPGVLGGVLIALGSLLFLLAITIVGAAVRDGVVAPGHSPTVRQLWTGRAAVGSAAVLLALALSGGRAWWNASDRDYRLNRMHRPVQCSAAVRVDGAQRLLQLTVQTNDTRLNWPGLVPDHGKLMHVFLVREPDMDVLAHIHPARHGRWDFEAALPPLPAGSYRVYADVTHETGFSQTLTAPVAVPPAPTGSPPGPGRLEPDPDDSWFTGRPAAGAKTCELGDGLRMEWESPGPLVAARETTLTFRVLEPAGQPARLEPYMSMLGHAAVRRDDGAVFMHLHPAGSASVAAQQVFQIRSGERPPKRITPEMLEKLCQLPSGDLSSHPLSFPYEFPKPGRYRLWVQVKTNGRVRTGVFDTEVAARPER